MSAWWESLSQLQRVFAYFALPATVILAVQTILVLFGLGDHDDGGAFDAHAMHDLHGGAAGHDGLALVSIRGIVAFFSVGGWAGIAAAGVTSPVLAVVFSLASGAAAMYGIALLLKIASGLQSAGNLKFDNAVGKTAKVYITIPGNGKGFGKVLLTFQDRFSECDAITQEPEELKAGETVKVVGLSDENTLIVAPISKRKIKNDKSEVKK